MLSKSKNTGFAACSRTLAIAALCGISLTGANAIAQDSEPWPEGQEESPEVVTEETPTVTTDETPVKTTPAAPVTTTPVEAVEPAPAPSPVTPAVEPEPTPRSSDMTVSAAAAQVELESEQTFRPFASLESSFYGFNNADFRELEPEDPIAVIDAFDADDRTFQSFTSIRGGFEYEPVQGLEVGISGGYKTVWGGDDLLFFDNANVAIDLLDGPLDLSLTVGRQPFEVGNAEAEYFFDDAVDAFVVDADLGIAGHLSVLAFDFYSSGARPDDLNISSGLGQEQETSFRANGDNNIYRTGAVYSNTALLDGLDIRLFGFYADIGATDGVGTGADRVFGQSIGNFADGDYTYNLGTRLGYTLDSGDFTLKVYGEFARSGGIDRKATNLGLFDVKTEGNALGAVVKPQFTINENFGVRGLLQFYRADGAQYASDNGVLFNHGFVSMKANQVGGLIANRISGWHPSAYVGSGGVHDNIHAIERIAGTMSLHGNLGLDIAQQLEVDFDVWYYADTSESNFGGDTITASSELPFGYDEFDLLAQERLGKTLGIELNARIGWRPYEMVSLYVEGGMLLPGEFYEIEVDRRVGSGGADQRVAVGSEDPVAAQAFMIGASLDI